MYAKVYVSHKMFVQDQGPRSISEGQAMLFHSLSIPPTSTDRSTAVRAMLRAQFPGINNQADPWHFVKVRLNI